MFCCVTLTPPFRLNLKQKQKNFHMQLQKRKQPTTILLPPMKKLCIVLVCASSPRLRAEKYITVGQCLHILYCSMCQPTECMTWRRQTQRQRISLYSAYARKIAICECVTVSEKVHMYIVHWTKAKHTLRIRERTLRNGYTYVAD